MSFFITSFLTYVLLYKYTALFIISFSAALILPLPSGASLAAAGAFASQGYMSFTAVFIVALIGNIGGDVTGYFLARRYGKATLVRLGFGKVFRSERYDFLRAYLEKFSYSLIFFSRFLPIGGEVNILSGVVGLTPRVFLFFDVIGETAFVSLYGFAGYILGTQWENNTWFLSEAVLLILSLWAVVLLVQFGLYRRKA